VTAPVVWLDCTGGVSGDMLLAALYDVGVDVRPAVDALGLGAEVTFAPTSRGGLRAVRCEVHAAADQPLRTLRDLRAVLDAADLATMVADRAGAVLDRLAVAEARAHGVDIGDVHFHELGAVDTVVDVVGACYGLHLLGVSDVVASPVALGGGTAKTGHGVIPVPGPAVLELLRDSDLAAVGGPDDVERATPTGIALLAEWATCAPMPAMSVADVGVGAGSRDLAGVPNVLRLIRGVTTPGTGDSTVLEANVDDLDPRLWPEVLDRLLAAGAADAWLTPIVMKKGRPAHVVAALVDSTSLGAVRETLFRETTTIGVREHVVGKTALDRDWLTVDVDGVAVRVKVARLAGAVVNTTPEWEDVLSAARTLGRPAKAVLASAIAAARDVR
jgi:uncharacterized protein (TIGR00299 family) protein